MTLTRCLAIAVAGLASALVATVGAAADWRDQVPVFRIGILGGELEADRLQDHACLKKIASDKLGVPVELVPSRDYSGVLSGLLNGEIDAAGLGAAGYAAIYLRDPDAVEPLVTLKQEDGSFGYHSVLLVRADSPYQSLDDLRGKSLVFTDRQSTSGYLIPNYELTRQGYEPMRFFRRIGFSRGHPQAVRAVLDGEYDAGVTWASGVGDYKSGYSRGNLHRMVELGTLDMSDIRILWQSGLIVAGPHVARQALPSEAKEIYRQVLLDLGDRDRACFERIIGGEAVDFEPVTHQHYETIIDIRRAMGG